MHVPAKNRTKNMAVPDYGAGRRRETRPAAKI